MTAHEFKIGDKVLVKDQFTTVGIYLIPCYVLDIDGDYYIMKRRDFNNSIPFRIGKYYPHMEKEN